MVQADGRQGGKRNLLSELEITSLCAENQSLPQRQMFRQRMKYFRLR